jgi:hypothetical protein
MAVDNKRARRCANTADWIVASGERRRWRAMVPHRQPARRLFSALLNKRVDRRQPVPDAFFRQAPVHRRSRLSGPLISFGRTCHLSPGVHLKLSRISVAANNLSSSFREFWKTFPRLHNAQGSGVPPSVNTTTITCQINCDTQAMTCQNSCVPTTAAAANPLAPADGSAACNLSCTTQQLVCKQRC